MPHACAHGDYSRAGILDSHSSHYQVVDGTGYQQYRLPDEKRVFQRREFQYEDQFKTGRTGTYHDWTKAHSGASKGRRWVQTCRDRAGR